MSGPVTKALVLIFSSSCSNLSKVSCKNFDLKERKKRLKSIIYISSPGMNEWSSDKGFSVNFQLLWFKSQ